MVSCAGAGTGAGAPRVGVGIAVAAGVLLLNAFGELIEILGGRGCNDRVELCGRGWFVLALSSFVWLFSSKRLGHRGMGGWTVGEVRGEVEGPPPSARKSARTLPAGTPRSPSAASRRTARRARRRARWCLFAPHSHFPPRSSPAALPQPAPPAGSAARPTAAGSPPLSKSPNPPPPPHTARTASDSITAPRTASPRAGTRRR